MAVEVELIIISGRSGSGKSVALRALEDRGFYCIDNLPLRFLPELITSACQHYPKLAVSIDIRNIPDNIAELSELYQKARRDPRLSTTVIYLDADDQTLIKRYSETRRLHPLSRHKLTLGEAISREDLLLQSISSIADLRIDTTNLSVMDLTAQIASLVFGRPEKQLVIIFESFGFKNGLVKDADFVFDSRFLPNPFWKKELRSCTGLEQPVRDFFAQYPEVSAYIDEIDALLLHHIPEIQKSNRSYLTVAIGCTGGQHRSVFIAHELATRFVSRGLTIRERHRTLDRTNPAALELPQA
ncbi:MAG: RNase adapter RapZ [Succinivibrio sp.]|nr:RNase adapter RapZ [Succinivibrio sp.]